MSDPGIHLPDSQVAGSFASGVRVSHSKWAFVLDFLVFDDRVGGDALHVVQRLRLDPSAVQQLLAILSADLDRYETEYGDPRKHFSD